MALESIIKHGIEKIKKNSRKAALLSAIAIAPFITGCDKLQHPLMPNINSAVTQDSASYHFCGQNTQYSVMPTQTPCSDVSYRTCMPGSGAWSEYQSLQDSDNDGKYNATVNSSNPGDGLIQFMVNGKESDPITFKYYMNHSQVISALTTAVNELGVIPVGSASESDITDAFYDTASSGYTSDAVIAVKNTSKRSSSNPKAIYHINIQDSAFDTNLTRRSNINAKGDGDLEILPVQSKDEIKSALQLEKTSDWMQASNPYSSFSLSQSGDVFSGENITFTGSSDADSIDVAVQGPNDASYGAYEAMTKSGSSFSKSKSTNAYGSWKAKAKVSVNRDVMTESFDSSAEKTVPVYMNGADILAMLPQIATEVGISGISKGIFYYTKGGNPTTVNENEIMTYDTNFDDGVNGVTDFIVGVKKDNPIRGPPSYEGFYYFDFKKASGQTINTTKESSINSLNEGYEFKSTPSLSKDDLKNFILTYKNASWPEIKP